ncbi:MAG TPA: hypothetical protein VLA89_13810 [Gemmatimonadales bacterium]|nr:hypothetical protein [Gemmatimonadales bacterium]
MARDADIIPPVGFERARYLLGQLLYSAAKLADPCGQLLERSPKVLFHSDCECFPSTGERIALSSLRGTPAGAFQQILEVANGHG